MQRMVRSLLFISLFLLWGCMKWDYGEGSTDFGFDKNGLFILCEGNFQYGNATLSFYDPETNELENEIFFRANGMRLGDVAQSMTIYGNKGWIVVNNSHVVFAIDTDTFLEVGRIENLTSPRYIHFISDKKAYISQIWDNRIAIVNPETYSITGYITVPDMQMGTGSTEQMVQIGQYVYCNCWSFQNKIIKIDTATDEVIESIIVGIQPNSLAIDKKGRLWTLTDGGYEDSAFGQETPQLLCLDTSPLTVRKAFMFNPGDSPSKLQTDFEGNRLYWINDDIWEMEIDAVSLPEKPLIPSLGTRYYGLTIDPVSSEVFVSDAIDYSQQGIVYRYSPEGEPVGQFYVGVNPGAFCWK